MSEGPPKPGSMFLRKQRSSGRIVRPGEIETQPPRKTTVEPPKTVRQSQGLFSVDQPSEEFDPKDVPDDEVEVYDPRPPTGTRSGGVLLRWFNRIAMRREV